MIDINLIRNKETRHKVIQSQKNRFKDSKIVEEVYELDKEKIKAMFDLEQNKKEINRIQKLIKECYKSKNFDNVQELTIEMKKIDTLDMEKKIRELDDEINKKIKDIGNILDESVVISNDEGDNKEVRRFRTERKIEEDTKPFSELMTKFTYPLAGSKIVGHRGYFLAGKMAKLASSLTRYAVDFLERRGYTLIQPPVMMRKDIMKKTSQLSDFDDQLYKVEDDMYLVATSEQPMAALFMDERMTQGDLPKKFCGQSLCFRKEAGAHGKDNAGLFRVHQFEKIEQFIYCAPEESKKLHEEMIRISEEFYQSLEISYNVVSIVSGELNDAASIKYDLEAFFPHANKYRELVSCSNCTDYQSRELEIRYGISKENNKKVYVHLLNGTLCAIQRTLCCIVENYQRGDVIVIPEVLKEYFRGDSIRISEE